MIQQQVEAFLNALFDPSEIVEFRFIPPKEKLGELYPKKIWYDGSTQKVSSIHKGELTQSPYTLYDNIRYWEGRGYNIYVGVNPREEVGVSGDRNVKRARLIVSDYDDMSAEQAEASYKDFVQPSMVICSGGGIHAYYMLKEAADMECWPQMQKDMADTLGSDPIIHNPERIMRVPGTINAKRNKLCEFISVTPVSYTFDELRARIPLGEPIGAVKVKVSTPKYQVGTELPWWSTNVSGKYGFQSYLHKVKLKSNGERNTQLYSLARRAFELFQIPPQDVSIELFSWYILEGGDVKCEGEVQNVVNSAWRGHCNQTEEGGKR